MTASTAHVEKGHARGGVYTWMVHCGRARRTRDAWSTPRTMSAAIDHLIENNRLGEAKKWFFTWRYTDDLCSFGDRGQSWDQLRYGMDHVDTTNLPFDSCMDYMQQ